MNPTLMLTAAGAALFVSALTKSRWRNRAAVRRDSFQVLTNVKAAANKVDNSAAEVEVALKGLMAA
jgi:hypothetical protein